MIAVCPICRGWVSEHCFDDGGEWQRHCLRLGLDLVVGLLNHASPQCRPPCPGLAARLSLLYPHLANDQLRRPGA